MPGAGEFRSSLLFASRGAGVADSDGNVETAYVNRFTVAARIRPRLGGEEMMAARLSGKAIATVTVRSTPDTVTITTDWKATDVDTGVVWNVRSPPIDPPDERPGHFLEMLCEKGVPV